MSGLEMNGRSFPDRTFVEPTMQSEGKALFFELGSVMAVPAVKADENVRILGVEPAR